MKYINVTASFDEDGKIIPIYITWDDGRRFDIDRVTDIRRAASLKMGGIGIRYTCSICGHTRYLFLDRTRWFVSDEEPQ